MAWEYWVLFALILIGVIGQNYFDLKWRNLYIFICVLLVFVGGFRYKLGPDWPDYYRLHEELVRLNLSQLLSNIDESGFERGYVLFDFICAKIINEIWFFQLVLIAVAIFVKARFIRKHLDLYFLGLSFYFMPHFFYADMVQIRQGFTGVILLYSTRYILEKRIWPFLFCIFLGYQFHTSSIVFILGYWIGNMKINFRILAAIVFVTVILSPLGISRPFAPLVELIPLSQVQETYLDYKSKSASGGFSFELNEIVKLLFFLTIVVYNSRAEKELGKVYLVFRNLFLFSILLFYFFKTEKIFAIRLPGQYAFYMGFVIPQILFVMRKKKFDYAILSLMVIIYFVLLTLRFQQLNSTFFSEYPNFIYYKFNKFDF